MYGSLVAAPDSIRTGLLNLFRPRTSPPSVATVLRSALWPIAIMSIIHRSYVLSSNGYITDDFGPVYRAVSNLRRGWDIYNEHFNYVDPHYLYPPGGTLLMAPFGYMPVFASHNWFVAMNTVAMIIAACVLVRLFGFSLTSVALPALLVAMFMTESVTNTIVFTNINGCVLLAEVLFFRWLLSGKVGDQWWAGVAIGLSLVVKPVLAVLLLLPLLNKQWRVFVTAFAVPLVFNVAAVVSPFESLRVADPMNFVKRTAPYIFSTRDYFNSSVLGNGTYFGLPPWFILLLRATFVVLAADQPVAAVPVLPDPRSAVLDADVLRDPADRVVVGAVAGAGLLLDDAVPVPDDGGAAQLGGEQLARVAGGVRVPDDGPVADVALADDWPLPGVHEDHLRLVAVADRGVLCAVLPLPGRQGRGQTRRRHRPAVDGREARRQG